MIQVGNNKTVERDHTQLLLWEPDPHGRAVTFELTADAFHSDNDMRLRWFRVFPLVRVLWRSVWVLVAVQGWVSQLLVLVFGVVGWVLLGVGARHSLLGAWWRLFASRAGVLGDADGEGALGVTWCRDCGGGCRGVVGDGTLARRWWGWWWC